MIKYITNPIHSLTQSYTAATITSLLTQQLRTRTLQPVPPGPSIIENDAYREASAKNSSKLNKFLHSEVNQLIQHIARSAGSKVLGRLVKVEDKLLSYMECV